MNKTILVSLLVILSTLGFGQSVDDFIKAGGALISSGLAKGEKDKLSKTAAKYNEDQKPLSLAGETVEVRPPNQWRYWNDNRQRWVRSSLTAMFTAVGAKVVWSGPEILDEARNLDSLKGNEWVDQGSLPKQGMKIGRYIIEPIFIEFDRSQELSAWWGGFWRGNEISLRRETSYFGLEVPIRDREEGAAVVITLKTVGSASDADNIGISISSFLGNRAGFQVSEEGSDARNARAMENALREMGEVIKQKCR